jgi:plastocyanin
MRIRFLFLFAACALLFSGCIIEKRAEIPRAAGDIAEKLIENNPIVPENQSILFDDKDAAPVNVPPSIEEVVMVRSKQIEPENLTIKAGTAVVWVNDDGLKHILIENNDEFSSYQKMYEKGSRYKYVFDDPGVYQYRDTVYGAKGKITVE